MTCATSRSMAHPWRAPADADRPALPCDEGLRRRPRADKPSVARFRSAVGVAGSGPSGVIGRCSSGRRIPTETDVPSPWRLPRQSTVPRSSALARPRSTISAATQRQRPRVGGTEWNTTSLEDTQSTFAYGGRHDRWRWVRSRRRVGLGAGRWADPLCPPPGWWGDLFRSGSSVRPPRAHSPGRLGDGCRARPSRWRRACRNDIWGLVLDACRGGTCCHGGHRGERRMVCGGVGAFRTHRSCDGLLRVPLERRCAAGLAHVARPRASALARTVIWPALPVAEGRRVRVLGVAASSHAVGRSGARPNALRSVRVSSRSAPSRPSRVSTSRHGHTKCAERRSTARNDAGKLAGAGAGRASAVVTST